MYFYVFERDCFHFYAPELVQNYKNYRRISYHNIISFCHAYRRTGVVGRYESHQNEANVYCEPQKGIVNIAAEPGNSTENNHYAHMSDI